MSELPDESIRLIKRYVIATLIWSAFVAGSLIWAIAIETEHTMNEAATVARSHFTDNRAFRLWAGSHGGVYVLVDENIRPSPELSHLPNRDLTTTTGLRLTLMHPSAILRQMMSIDSNPLTVRQKLTSFPEKLLIPANMPDEWELEALALLKQKSDEIIDVSLIDGVSHMRLMKPLLVEQGCLTCHEDYRAGELSGGLSISLPIQPYLEHRTGAVTSLSISHLIIWLAGMTGGYFSFRQNTRLNLERVEMISQLTNANSKLERYSYQDGLTQVANRRMLDALLEREWASAMRTNQPLALIMIDIDFFKDYNDGYGHQAGDDCLKRIATALGSVSQRSTDVVARYGGEEFVVLLPNTGIGHARNLAERCRETVSDLQLPHAYSDAADIVTISVGVMSAIPARGSKPDMLIKGADQALYRAKKAGRNRVEHA